MSPTSWICDVCGDAIEKPERGLLAWKSDDEGKRRDFRIVHKGDCDSQDFKSSIELHQLTGIDGQARLFALISRGPLLGGESLGVANLDEWIDVFRRLQTPYYEDARQRFDDAEVRREWADANEVQPYTQRSLKQIAETGD